MIKLNVLNQFSYLEMKTEQILKPEKPANKNIHKEGKSSSM